MLDNLSLLPLVDLDHQTPTSGVFSNTSEVWRKLDNYAETSSNMNTDDDGEGLGNIKVDQERQQLPLSALALPTTWEGRSHLTHTYLIECPG